MEARPHELATFLRQDAEEMRSEYERIRSITPEDPGTAGDEGEETWASLLREWLPESHRVVTKGRLVGANGDRGPQLDVIVLRPGYPQRLINKKLYLVGGVAAAFECKNTLKPEHLTGAFAQAQALVRLSSERSGTPFRELVPEIYFGVLAHDTVWTSSDAGQLLRIDALLQDGLSGLEDVRACPSLVCIASLGCWSVLRSPFWGPPLVPADAWEAQRERGGPIEPHGSITYMRFRAEQFPAEQAPFNPLSAAIANIVGRLAFDDATVRSLSQYLFAAGSVGSAVGVAAHTFSPDEFSPEVRAKLPWALVNGEAGSEWSMVYPF